MLNKYDFQQFAKTPVAQAIHRNAQNELPEIGTFPSVVLDGETYDTPILKKKGDAPIFCSVSEGARSSKSIFDDKRNNTFGFDRLVEAPVRATNSESKESKALLGMNRFNYEKTDVIRQIFNRMSRQLYLGAGLEAKGFEGFPSAVVHKIDALSGEWNDNADYDEAALTAAGISTTQLYSVYLLRVAESATIESPGLKWIWGNGTGIRDGKLSTQEIVDEEKTAETGQKCSYEAYVQHVYGDVGFAWTSEFDVIEIANVPASTKLDGFYLENVISQAGVVYNGANKFNRILTHKLAHQAMWLKNQAQNNKRNVSIIAPTADGGFSRKMPSFFDGVDETPIIVSDVMPSTGLQTPEAQTVKELFDKTHAE